MRAGLQLTPTERVVIITNRPVLDVNFSQFRAKVSGTISCMGKHSRLPTTESLNPKASFGHDSEYGHVQTK